MTGSKMSASPCIDIRGLWKHSSGVLAQAMRPGAGYSLDYEGKSQGPEFSDEWQRIGEESSRDTDSVTLQHQSGLVITRQARLLSEFNTVEYQVLLKNTAQTPLSPVSQLRSLNLSFGEAVLYGNCVVSSGGGLFDATFPPDSFAIRKRYFPLILDEFSTISTRVELTTEGGRSSSKDLPFFFIHNEAKQEGMFVAFGWSGQWTIWTWLDPKTATLNVTGKIPGLDIALEPGEEIQGPTILVGFYQGPLWEGSNQLRRLIGERYTPKLDGERFLPFAAHDTWLGGIGVNYDEPLLHTLIDEAAALGQEYFTLDAGWVADEGWGQGSWTEVDRTKLPNGLKPLSDHVRAKGLKFGMWFDLEFVARGSRLAREHPEWVLWNYEKSSSAQEDLRRRWVGDDRGLLDLRRPEARQWACDVLDHYFREYGVRYIRYDFNLAPLPYWDATDEPRRRGMTQLRYMEGLYAVFDWILEHHPGVVIEGCASGGRRIDLEMIRRTHTCWISDYSTDPKVLQFNLHGINHFLPGNYHYTEYVLPAIHQNDFTADDMGFQRLFAGCFGIGGRMDRWSPSMKQMALRHVETWKRLRRYLLEDYYPLTPQPRDLESWSGWQFHDPKTQSGFAQSFRTNTPDATHRFVLYGLQEKARYRFTDAYDAQFFDVMGSTAMEVGIELTQAPMTSKVLTYEKLEK